MTPRLTAGLTLALFTLAAVQADDPKPEEGFTSLFNGKDLSGWTYRGSKDKLDGKTETPDGRIAVEDGVLVMRATDRDGKGGIKVIDTATKYGGAFTLRVEFRAGLKADSGVYVRGPQLQVRDFIRRNEHKHLKKFKNDGWNELEVVVRDGVTTTSVNNRVLTDADRFEATFEGGKVKAATLNGKPVEARAVQVRKGSVAYCSCNGEPFETMLNLPASGPIGLQAEGGKFEFRKVRVRVDR
jgi:hypothetical protein